MTFFEDYWRGIGSVRLTVDYGQEVGVSVPDMLAGTGIDLVALNNPDAEIRAEQELQVITNLLSHISDTDRHGYTLGLRYHFSAYGLWGYGLMCCATARDALSLALQFLPLTYAYCDISFHRDGDEGVLSFIAPRLEPRLSRFLVVRDMTAAAVLVKELIGNDFELHSVSRRDTPEPGAFFLEPLDVAVEYGADKNQARFAYQVLARTMPMANVITAAQCEQQCQDLMVRRRRCSGVATLVRHALTQAGEGRSALAGIASRLNMTERTLKRHLREEGTCFRHLLEEHLSHQACQLLGRPGTTVAGVAEQLGFSDASSFSQAFKRWTGDSPRGYQQARQRGLLA